MSGMSFPRAESTCADDEVAPRDAEEKTETLSRWKGFRLTEREHRRLLVYATRQGVSASKVLRRLVQQAVRDVE